MKITKYLLSMAAALGMFAGCYKPEMVQVSAPEDVIAPVLEAIDGPIDITAENMASGVVEFKWSLADYGVLTQVDYSIEVATAAAPAAVVTVTSGLTADTTALNANLMTAKIDYETLNQILFNDLALADGYAEDILFTVAAKVGEYPKVYSNAVKVSAKVTAAEKVYPVLTVAGSYAYNNWSPGKGQFVFDFDGADAKYSGMIDFGEDVSALNFKFVGTKWGENEYSVPEGTEQAPEAAELPLQAGGGDNISAYTTHRYVSLTLDKATPKVVKNFSFNQLGVIGDFNGWGEDVVMTFNPAKQRFYADVDFTADGGFKFRADAGWDLNWGVSGGVLAAGADNIPVTAGKYRVYVNMNNPAEMTFELNAKAFGTEEGTTAPEPEPEPEPEAPAHKGWALIGGFNDWAGDLALTSDGTYYVVKGVELEGELKFRKDAAWDVNLGLAEGAEFAANAEIALAANGGNINVAAATYDVYLDDVNSKAWFITDGTYPGGGAAPEASIYGIVGDVNGWNAPDIALYKTATEGLFVAKNVAMPDGGFKIRANGVWDDTANYGLAAAGAVEVNHAYDLVCSGGSGDMKLVAGTYDIWFDLANLKVYIMTPGKAISEAVGGEATTPDPSEQTWHIVGNFNEWNPGDAAYVMTAEGDYYVYKNFTAAAGCELKFAPGAWNGDKGGDGTFAANTDCPTGSSNIAVAEGTYDIYLKKDLSAYYFMTPGTKPAN